MIKKRGGHRRGTKRPATTKLAKQTQARSATQANPKPKKTSHSILTDKTQKAASGVRAELTEMFSFLGSLLVGLAGLLPFIVMVGFGLMYLYGMVPLGEVGHRVLGIFLVLYGGLASVLAFINGQSFARCFIQSARMMSASGVVVGIIYVFHGLFVLAAFVLPISLLVLVGMHYLFRYLYTPEAAKKTGR